MSLRRAPGWNRFTTFYLSKLHPLPILLLLLLPGRVQLLRTDIHQVKLDQDQPRDRQVCAAARVPVPESAVDSFSPPHAQRATTAAQSCLRTNGTWLSVTGRNELTPTTRQTEFVCVCVCSGIKCELRPLSSWAAAVSRTTSCLRRWAWPSSSLCLVSSTSTADRHLTQRISCFTFSSVMTWHLHMLVSHLWACLRLASRCLLCSCRLLLSSLRLLSSSCSS